MADDIPVPEKKPTPPSATAQPSGRALPYTAVFLASACVMTAELLASRLIARYLGQSLYTWTSCIGVFLGGIALGNYVGGRLADHPKPRRTLSIIFVLCALATLLTPLLNYMMASIPWMWERSWATRIFLHVTITFILPALLLGGVSPVAAKMAVGTAQGEHVGRTLGILYALGALGSIVGTYLTGFWLIARFGTVPTLASVSAVLMLLALCVMPRSRSALVGLLLAAIIAVGTASRTDIYPLRALHFVEEPDDGVLFERESPYSLVKVEIIDEEKDQLGMHLDRLLHSQMIRGRPEKILYEYMQVYVGLMDHLHPQGKPLSTLVLGGGGYVFPWYVELTRPGSRIDVVEIDPDVTEAAHDGFGLPRDTTINSFCEDARQYMERLAREIDTPPYDLIFSDVVSDYGVPFHLTTVEFSQLTQDLLKKNGVWAFNLIDSGATADLLTSTLKTCREVFPYVRAVLCAGNLQQRATFVLVCSYREVDYDTVLAQVRKKQPFNGRFLTKADEATLESRGKAILLTDDYAPVEQMIGRMLTTDTELQAAEFADAGTRAMQAGKPTRALQLFARAVEIGAQAPIPYYNYGLALHQQGRPNEAIKQLYEALARNQNYLAAHDLAGSILSQHGRYDKAGVHWEFVTRIDPTYVPGWNNLANVLLILNRTEEARTCIEKAASLSPDNMVTRVLMGNLLLAENRPNEAVLAFKNALSVAPQRVEIMANLASALEQSGNRQNAMRYYRMALQRQPGYPPALEALQRLKDRSDG